MLREIDSLTDRTQPFFDDNVDMLHRLLGRPYGNVSEIQAETILLVILRTVSTMYREHTKQKKGIKFSHLMRNHLKGQPFCSVPRTSNLTNLKKNYFCIFCIFVFFSVCLCSHYITFVPQYSQ